MIHITRLIELLGILVYCSFMAIFILPRLFFYLFYTLPQTARFSLGGRIQYAAFLPTLTKVFVWVVLVSALYLIAFVLDISAGYALVASPGAIACWFLCGAIILTSATIGRKRIQAEFYENIYLKYICKAQKETYDQYLSSVAGFTYQRALEEKGKKLSYLQKEAVNNRIQFLLEESSKSPFLAKVAGMEHNNAKEQQP